jgi:hypothetical protein
MKTAFAMAKIMKFANENFRFCENRRNLSDSNCCQLFTINLSYIHLGTSVCHPVCHPVVLSYSCHSCGTLSYYLCFSDQTDQGNETEGLEMEGLQMER